MAVKKLCGACGEDALERNPTAQPAATGTHAGAGQATPEASPHPAKTSAPPAGNPPTKPTPNAKPASNANRGVQKQKAANPTSRTYPPAP